MDVLELAIPDDRMKARVCWKIDNRYYRRMCIKKQGLIDMICAKEYNDKNITKTGTTSKRSVRHGGF